MLQFTNYKIQFLGQQFRFELTLVSRDGMISLPKKSIDMPFFLTIYHNSPSIYGNKSMFLQIICLTSIEKYVVEITLSTS